MGRLTLLLLLLSKITPQSTFTDTEAVTAAGEEEGEPAPPPSPIPLPAATIDTRNLDGSHASDTTMVVGALLPAPPVVEKVGGIPFDSWGDKVSEIARGEGVGEAVRVADGVGGLEGVGLLVDVRVDVALPIVRDGVGVPDTV